MTHYRGPPYRLLRAALALHHFHHASGERTPR